MQTKAIIANIYDRDYDWAIPEGMMQACVDYKSSNDDGDDGLDRDEMLVTVTYGTVAEVVASWGVNFVAASDTPNMDYAPLFQSRPRYIDRDWMRREARDVEALEA